MKRINLLVVVLLILVLAPLTLADIDYPDIPCSECQAFFGNQGYCKPATNTCSLRETSTSAVVTTQGDSYQELQQKVNSLATGLASTQAELDSVEEALEEEQLFTSILKYTILALIAIAFMIIVIYLIINQKSTKKGNSEIISYITQHIKGGKKYPHIKSKLLQAGWSNTEIESAYKKTMKHNYNRYKKETIPTSKNKIIAASVISVVVLLGVVFLLRGVTTGKAIEFGSQVEFEISVENNLKIAIPNSQFFPLVNNANLCVQVQDGTKSVSFSVAKSGTSLNINKVANSCTSDVNYDGALLFTDWNTFNVVSRKSTCENIRNQHGDGLYVLPSKYVLPGFAVNPTRDYTPFCTVLNTCLTPAEKTLIGC